MIRFLNKKSIKISISIEFGVKLASLSLGTQPRNVKSCMNWLARISPTCLKNWSLVDRKIAGQVSLIMCNRYTMRFWTTVCFLFADVEIIKTGKHNKVKAEPDQAFCIPKLPIFVNLLHNRSSLRCSKKTMMARDTSPHIN